MVRITFDRETMKIRNWTVFFLGVLGWVMIAIAYLTWRYWTGQLQALMDTQHVTPGVVLQYYFETGIQRLAIWFFAGSGFTLVISTLIFSEILRKSNVSKV